jgi:Amt family ammonium transporter
MVLFMTPGLAFFYGGLVRASSVVSMMMMSFGSIALIGVMWVIFGYAMSFGNAGHGNYVGFDGIFGIDLNQLFLGGVLHDATDHQNGLNLVFAGFQGTFAIITVALISGAIADRAKFGSWMIFAGVWATVVYFPVASWIFNFQTDATGKITSGGWLVYRVGVLDFAGGTAVEIASGASALALALVVGKRFGFAKGMYAPHNVPLVLIGVGILWFGWFGFNAGSALAANGTATLAFINTFVAPVAGLLSWSLYEKLKHGKATSVGAGSGAVAALVAITPSCGYLTPGWALVLGAIVGVDLVGGLVGTLFLGFFANGSGLFYSGSFDQLGKQAIGAFTVLIYAFCMSYAIGWVIQKTIGLRITSTDEIAGIDLMVHGESGYSGHDPRWNWRLSKSQ